MHNKAAEALGSAVVKDSSPLHNTSLLTSCQGSVLRMPVWEALKAAILSGLDVGVVFSVKMALWTGKLPGSLSVCKRLKPVSPEAFRNKTDPQGRVMVC